MHTRILLAGRRAPSPVIAAIALLGLLLSLTSVAAAAPRAELLATQRWHENATGLSLLPPRGAQQIDLTASGGLVRFVHPDGFAIRVAMIEHELDLNLNSIKDAAFVELQMGARFVELIEESAPKYSGHDARLAYLRSTARDAAITILGRAYVRIDERTIASIHLETSEQQFPAARATFEAVLESLQFADPTELAKVRMAWIRAGERWKSGLDRELLKKAMVAEQWFRVLEQGEDVGYTRIRHSLDTMLDLPGIKIEVDSRIVVGKDTYDTVSFFWESDDAKSELWSIRTARRSLAAPHPATPANVPPPPPAVVEETGLRSPDGNINVERRAPGKVDKFQWGVPRSGYASQVETHLIPTLVPRDGQQDLGFYAYSSNDTNLALRTLQVFPQQDGTYVVRERPAPDRAELVSTYDNRGRLVRRQMADGRLIVPATPEQMKKIWDIR